MADQPNTARRALLKAIPAGLLAGAAMAQTAPTTETTVMALFREWAALDADEQTICGLPDLEDNDPRLDAVTDRKGTVTRAMLAAPKTCLQDVALCVLAATEFGAYGVTAEQARSFRGAV